MSKDLSQIVTELFASPEGKELSSQIQRLGDELRTVTHSDDTIFGKFQGLLASFKEVIPDENQRYHAALKALATTAKLDNKAIIKALKAQVEELKIVERSIMPSLSGWSEGLKDMEARAQQLKGEIAGLRDKLTVLEGEEKTIQAGISAREKDLKNAERTITGLFADIGKEISGVNKKIGELTGEPVAEEPAPEKAPGKKKKKVDEAKDVEITVAAVPMDSKFQRKCPMCGGSFNLHELENMWQCYTCGHEEPASGAVLGTGGPADEPASALAPGPVFDPSAFHGKRAGYSSTEDEGPVKGSLSSYNEPEIQKKRCPGCGKTMFHYPKEKAWRCPSCGYERRI